jgi:hypothetical protein
MRTVTPLARALALPVVSAVAWAPACSTSQTLPCAAPGTAECPSLDGVTSFCEYAQWGCAASSPCGGYFAVVDPTVDAKLTYFYAAATGAYVATVSEPSDGPAVCTVGPASFAVPSSCSFVTLAECSPRGSGVPLGPSDASVDAPFTTPVPSGMPSAQPQEFPRTLPTRR